MLAPPEPVPTLLSLALSLALCTGRLTTVDQISEFVDLELIISANGKQKTSPWGGRPPWEVGYFGLSVSLDKRLLLFLAWPVVHKCHLLGSRIHSLPSPLALEVVTAVLLVAVSSPLSLVPL